MHICIDSSVFIRGIQTRDATIAHVFRLIGVKFALSVPRLVVNEVTRNLIAPHETRIFYKLFQHTDASIIIEEPVPAHFVEKYIRLGLPAKADAFIGAFAEWQAVKYLLSDNRHFLRRLQTSAFTVLTPDEFIVRWQQNEL
ncbi:MAG: PIN domain-containing protein [Caldilineaceae bacterium]